MAWEAAMARIEQLRQPTDFRPYCMTLSEPELAAQQIVQRGAIHALDTLLANGGSKDTARGMLESLHANMKTIEAVARARGFRRLFDGSSDHEPDAQPTPDAGYQLHRATLAIIERLAALNPAAGTVEGELLEELSAAQEVYEKAMFPLDGDGVETLGGVKR